MLDKTGFYFDWYQNHLDVHNQYEKQILHIMNHISSSIFCQKQHMQTKKFRPTELVITKVIIPDKYRSRRYA